MSEPMITRTKVGVSVRAMTADIPNQTVEEQTYYLKGTWTSEAKILKRLQKDFNTDERKIIAVISTEPVNCLYGMPESKFFELAEPMEAVQKKRAEYAMNKAKKTKTAK